MRPPEFTGGNGKGSGGLSYPVDLQAPTSMRPPEFTGGNVRSTWRPLVSPNCAPHFNEAAGIHRRKPARRSRSGQLTRRGFNEAAGIHRRKLRD